MRNNAESVYDSEDEQLTLEKKWEYEKYFAPAVSYFTYSVDGLDLAILYVLYEVRRMKGDLLDLIEQIDDIKKNFHIVGGNGIPRLNAIYDTPIFSNWKQEVQFELQNIYDLTKDKYIWNVIVILEQSFNGWKDETAFNDLSGSLYAIRKNINKYYSEEKAVNRTKEEITMEQKSPKIFISHSSSDKDYVSKLIDLLESIGLNEKHIFCSSIAGYGIPLGQDIYDYLKLQFETHNLHIILVLSQNYYNSVPCMNEMGAAWILQNRYTIILLPGFEFKEIKGAINPRQIGLKLDNDLTDIKEKLCQLKDALLNEFGLPAVSDIRWEQKRDIFISTITTISEKEQSLLQATNKKNILVISYNRDLYKIPKVNDIVPIPNQILGDIKLNQIESFALIQGSKNGGGVKIKYLVKGTIEKNSSYYKNYNYIVKVTEVNFINEVHITPPLDNGNTLFSLDELLNIK